MPDRDSSWLQDRGLVLATLERHEELLRSLNDVRVDIAVIKTRLAAYAAFGGFIAGSIATVIQHFIK